MREMLKCVSLVGRLLHKFVFIFCSCSLIFVFLWNIGSRGRNCSTTFRPCTWKIQSCGPLSTNSSCFYKNRKCLLLITQPWCVRLHNYNIIIWTGIIIQWRGGAREPVAELTRFPSVHTEVSTHHSPEDEGQKPSSTTRCLGFITSSSWLWIWTKERQGIG